MPASSGDNYYSSVSFMPTASDSILALGNSLGAIQVVMPGFHWVGKWGNYRSRGRVGDLGIFVGCWGKDMYHPKQAYTRRFNGHALDEPGLVQCPLIFLLHFFQGCASSRNTPNSFICSLIPSHHGLFGHICLGESLTGLFILSSPTSEYCKRGRGITPCCRLSNGNAQCIVRNGRCWAQQVSPRAWLQDAATWQL